jgi:AcrR family transcriptional regulator
MADSSADEEVHTRMAITAQTGRKLGPRALKTRQRLLDSTAELLKKRSVLDISVVEIARKSETSPATFYHYFKDVEEAVLLLAEQAAEEMPSVVAQMTGNWNGQQGMDTARAVVSAFIDHWEAHHAVLLVRNLSADKGDARFQRIRRTALTPVIDQFAEQIESAQTAGKVSSEIHPMIASAAMVAILERLSAHFRTLHHFRASRDELIETCARILHQVLTGRSSR